MFEKMNDCAEAFYSHVFSVTKKEGKTRLVTDFRALNLHIKCEHFKMEGLKSLKLLATPGCWCASIDLKTLSSIIWLLTTAFR